MQDRYETVKEMESQLGEFDTAIEKTFKKIEQTYLDSDIPLPIRKKMEAMIDSRKDFADKVEEMKWELDHSWEELEKNAHFILSNLNRSIKKMMDEMN